MMKHQRTKGLYTITSKLKLSLRYSCHSTKLGTHKNILTIVQCLTSMLTDLLIGLFQNSHEINIIIFF